MKLNHMPSVKPLTLLFKCPSFKDAWVRGIAEFWAKKKARRAVGVSVNLHRPLFQADQKNQRNTCEPYVQNKKCWCLIGSRPKQNKNKTAKGCLFIHEHILRRKWIRYTHNFWMKLCITTPTVPPSRRWHLCLAPKPSMTSCILQWILVQRLI